jgi:hypothetical protein
MVRLWYGQKFGGAVMVLAEPTPNRTVAIPNHGWTIRRLKLSKINQFYIIMNTKAILNFTKIFLGNI